MDALIIADDLSGAADCAAAARRASVVALDWPPLPQSGLIAVDLNSRKASAADAAARAGRAVDQLASLQTCMLYHKIDSLLRGNWAAELAAIRQALSARRARPQLAVLTPAWPERGRTVVNGIVHLEGVPLKLKGLRADDGSSLLGDLATNLKTAGLKTTVIGTNGPGGDIQAQLLDAIERGFDVAICDAATRAHLDLIAASSVSLAERVFWAGSAGLMGSLSSAMGWVSEPSRLPTLGRTAVLIVVGSASATSRAQLEQLRQSGTHVIAIKPADLAANSDSPRLRTIADQIAAHVATGSNLAVAIEAEDAPDLRSGTDLVRKLVQLLLPFIPEFGGMILTGGETARGVLGAMGISALRLLTECEPGVPVSLTLGDDQIPVITKAGAFGGPATLVRALAVLQGCPTFIPQSGTSP